MNELFVQLKKMTFEPKVYSMIVKSPRGQFLHLGVHFSLEEAYAVARARLQALVPHKPADAIDIDSWNYMTAQDAILQFFDKPAPKTVTADPPLSIAPIYNVGGNPAGDDLFKTLMALADSEELTIAASKPQLVDLTIADYVEDVKEAKNDLLQKLIDTADIAEVEKQGKMLTSYERRYVLRKIAEKQPKG